MENITIEKLAATLKQEALRAVRWMNDRAAQGDRDRNHVNYGVMSQALSTLRLLGYEAVDATWSDGDLLICEHIKINGEIVFKR